MIDYKQLIKRTIKLREEMKDPVKEYATRNKDSPIDNWNESQVYSPALFNLSLNTDIEAAKLKFKYVTLTINFLI